MGGDQVSIRSSEPIFPVADVVATVRYYRDVLGFSEEWVWGEPPDFACVARDEVELFLSLTTQRVASGSWLSIFVQDVDALYEDYKTRGAIIRQPPTEYPWGMREMNVEDLDGHRFRLGTDGGTENRTYNYEKEDEAV